ncbi:DISARM system phospholipase D-like protein DrmC [Nocardia wallacei]|uniref:DISARM system phospholipase D-like protein DrmC n=1 Tax=Nocardia wallacei TaxID=480035 RepID=UPI002456C868|nr:DISARM system phospholipase D-like protein DrmC [Nocardia wallacei]
MDSSAGSADPARRLGELLTGTEAADIADRLELGATLPSALRSVDPVRRVAIRPLLDKLGSQYIVAVLRAVEGARSVRTVVEPLWTIPGSLAREGWLTSEVSRLIDGSRHSIVCSTFNFQRSSGVWDALRHAAHRPGVTVKVYLDTNAADAQPNSWSPTTAEVAAHLQPAVVYRTTVYDGAYVRNHAKLLAIDHRFLLVTSANFSHSAEHHNIEFGLYVDNPNLAEAVERQLFAVEDMLYERVEP